MAPDFQNGTLVTANRRLARQFRRDFDRQQRARGNNLWRSADILPFRAWLERTWDECAYSDPLNTPILLSSHQERVLWEQAISDFGADDGLLNLRQTSGITAEAWGLLHQWQLPQERRAFEITQDTEAFWAWMNATDRRLSENGWITASELPRALHARASSQRLAIEGPLYFADFDEMSPAELRLFRTLDATEYSETFAPGRATRIGFPDQVSEIEHAAHWARKMLKSAPGAQIGIIVRGLASLVPILERIFDDTLHPDLSFHRSQSTRSFHISAGNNFVEVPIITTALSVLQLVSGLPRARTEALLRSPFSRIKLSEANALEAELRIRGTDEVSIRLDSVRRVFPEFAYRKEQLPAKQLPSEWSFAFSKLLASAGWPGERTLSSVERQAIDHWKDLLSEFARLDLVLPRIGFDRALNELRSMVLASRFAPDDPKAPIQIMDVLEAAGSRFDAAWIMGVHSGGWPDPLHPNPFLPIDLIRAASAPHSSVERELEYTRKITQRLLSCAREVVCSYPEYSGEEKLRPSSLIEDLPVATGLIDSVDTALHRVFVSAPALERYSSELAPAIENGTEQRGGMRVIADQAACPFRAFAVHRLRARETEAPGLGLSPIERGGAAHIALQLIWNVLKSRQELLTRSAEEVSALIRECVDSALNQTLNRRDPNDALGRFRVLEQARLEQLLSSWIEAEKERPDFEVIGTELASTIGIGGLRLNIKADRLDRLADGSVAILDYKTSKELSIKSWVGDRPDAPQLPLYAIASAQQVSGIFFAQLFPGKTGLLGLDEIEFQKNLPEWRKALTKLAEDFAAGHAEVDPKSVRSTCDLCDLQPLCRIAEIGGGSE